MTDNIFFNRADLKHCGSNVIIGKTARIRYPELVSIGDNVIIDDFTYISTQLVISSFVHISSGCSIIGGRNAMVSFGQFSTLAPNVVLAAGSDDYISGLATPMVDEKFKGNVNIGKIDIGDHCIIGANSTVLPNVTLADGANVGANSLVKEDLEGWCLYAGSPVRFIKKRDASRILELEKRFRQSN